MNISKNKQILIVYFVLTLAAMAVFGQVYQFGFINLDDAIYVEEDYHVQRGITPEGVFWAFTTTNGRFWFPMTWLSFMFDYQFFGLNAGGYHVVNLILHIFGTLLLFRLFNRMTGAIWRSAFIAAVFALHPLHVETVAWVAKRKDVLSAFFWMLTLCLYVYYTGKPVIRRYLLVFFSFILALMSKPMVVTLPAMMILLDYWPLKRFESKKENLFLWQLKEKIPFFALSFLSVLLLFSIDQSLKPDKSHNVFTYGPPLVSRLANATVSFVTYLEKMFWPRDLAAFYPFSDQIPSWQVIGASLLIIIITSFVVVKMKRFPYLFVGWLWYTITILPVIGIIHNSERAMSDNYSYLPSIGIAVMLAWGIPLLFTRDRRKKILLPAGTVIIAILAVLAWRQCGYWKNSIELWDHALQATKNNYFAHNWLGVSLAEKGRLKEAIDNLDKTIRLNPNNADAYNDRGNAYNNFGQYQQAIEDYNESIRLNPNNADAYNGRGNTYYNLGQFQLAIDNYTEAIHLKTNNYSVYKKRGTVYYKLGRYQEAIDNYTEAIRSNPYEYDAYLNRGVAYYNLGRYQRAVEDYDQVIRLSPHYAEGYNNRGLAYGKLGRHQLAVDNFSEAIRLNPDDADAYNNRGFAYLLQGNKELGCRDAQKACEQGRCKLFEFAENKSLCR